MKYLLLLLFMIAFTSCTNPPSEYVQPPEKAAIVSLRVMNVLFIGVDNPIDIKTINTFIDSINISIDKGRIFKKKGRYFVSVTKPGRTTITIKEEGEIIGEYSYRVKRVPAPVPFLALGCENGGCLASLKDFKELHEMETSIPNFDFNVDCTIRSFVIGRVRQGQSLIEYQNEGADFSSQTTQLIQKAKKGDLYYFHKIKARCSGHGIDNPVGSLVYKII